MFSRFNGLGFGNIFGPIYPPGEPPHQYHHSPPGPSHAGGNSDPANTGQGFVGRIGNPPPSGAEQQHEIKYARSGEIDNSEAIMAKISALYYGRVMSDITLVIGRREYPSHRLILCASSDVFQVMLMNSSWLEAQSARVELQETSECVEYFEDFLKYLYTGLANLELVNVLHLLTLADKYNIKDLVDLCLDYMIKHIPAAANHCKLIQWYKHLSGRGHEMEARACKNFIKWNFEFVANADDFVEIDSRQLINILLEDDLVVFDEYSLFRWVAHWLESQAKNPSNDDPDLEEKLTRLVEETMECIRFPLMSPRQLADMVLVPITQKYKEFFMEKMTIGMAFHSDINQAMDLVLRYPFRAKLFTPRHYCTDKWSVCLSVDNFHTFSHFQSKTLVFSTPVSLSEKDADRQTEWVVDLYPKGVSFGKYYLINWQGTVECPHETMKTVRLSVHCKNENEEGEPSSSAPIRVQIGILIAGIENNVEHVKKVIKKNYIFSGPDKILIFDDIIPYDELVRTLLPNTPENRPDLGPMLDPSAFESVPIPDSELADFHAPPGVTTQFWRSKLKPQKPSPYLCNNSLKVRIVITPMSEIKI